MDIMFLSIASILCMQSFFVDICLHIMIIFGHLDELLFSIHEKVHIFPCEPIIL